MCARSLAATGKALIAQGRLTDVLRRLAAFGITLVRLDVRQSAERHTEALDCITRSLGLGSYAAWPERERQQFLARELDNPRPLIPYDLDAPPDVREVLDTFHTIAQSSAGFAWCVRRVDGDPAFRCCRRGPVAEGSPRPPAAEDRSAGRDRGQPRRCRRHVGMLLDIPEYRALLGSRQEVMIGYSDSAREIGRFSAAWSLYRAQEDIVAACRAPRRGGHAVPWPRRDGRSGRRTDVTGDPSSRPDRSMAPARDRTGRDDPGEVRPGRNRAADARGLYHRHAREDARR